LDSQFFITFERGWQPHLKASQVAGLSCIRHFLMFTIFLNLDILSEQIFKLGSGAKLIFQFIRIDL